MDIKSLHDNIYYRAICHLQISCINYWEDALSIQYCSTCQRYISEGIQSIKIKPKIKLSRVFMV
jgi:hypothetical protein